MLKDAFLFLNSKAAAATAPATWGPTFDMVPKCYKFDRLGEGRGMGEELAKRDGCHTVGIHHLFTDLECALE